MNPTLPTWETIRLVMPEIWLAVGMCAVILVPFIKRQSVALPTIAALGGLFLALASAVLTLGSADQAVLGSTLAIDPFSQFFKILLLLFTILVIAQWIIATRQETAVTDTPDFLCLLLGAALGMALMASARNLLMIFVATETASFPSYALAGFRKRHRIGSEGSLKYVIFGSAASAIMIYGMSLIYGLTGSLDLATIAQQAVTLSKITSASGAVSYAVPPLLAVGLLALFAGFAFKLSAVPLHFWCPDVFQGAPTEVTTFLSVASKGAAMALLLRVLLVLGSVVPPGSGLFTGLAVGVAIMGAVTATWGNLVAFHQNNIKRLLAYSSIAHAGYMIMACSLVVFLAGVNTGVQNPVAGAILFYLLVYLFMNLGAFTVAALVASHAGTEDIRDYAGLSRRSPALAVLMTLFLFSLFGMPGLGGFMGKIYLAVAMLKVGAVGFVLIAVLLLNTLISLYFYARPIYYMYFVADTEERPNFMPQPAGLLMLALCAAALLWTGLFSSGVNGLANDYSMLLQTAPVAAIQATPAEPPTRISRAE